MRRFFVVALHLVLVAGGMRGLLYEFPDGWPVFAWVVPSFRALPLPAALLIGAVLGVAGVLALAGASRVTPYPWSVIFVCLGFAILAFFAAGTALGVVSEPFGDVPFLVPIAGALVPLGVGLFGLQRILGRESNEPWVPGVGMAIFGLFLALQVIRAADVQPPPPKPAPAGAKAAQNP